MYNASRFPRSTRCIVCGALLGITTYLIPLPGKKDGDAATEPRWHRVVIPKAPHPDDEHRESKDRFSAWANVAPPTGVSSAFVFSRDTSAVPKLSADSPLLGTLVWPSYALLGGSSSATTGGSVHVRYEK